MMDYMNAEAVESKNRKPIICVNCPHREDCEEMPYDVECDKKRMK